MLYNKDLVGRVATYVKLHLHKEHTGHDWFHALRVLQMARKLHKEEDGDLMLIELSALVHDLGDYKKYGFSENKGNLALNAMMDILDIDRRFQKKIMKIVIQSQYQGRETKIPDSIEGKIIQDSDWLDTLGAIGIARNFSTGGDVKRIIHNPKIKPRLDFSKLDYQRKKSESTSFNYFFEKPLKILALLNTKTAKRIGEQRIRFLKLYINQFLEEWDGKR